jgi:CubicO group peptidase (beta-lactamase class C family)
MAPRPAALVYCFLVSSISATALAASLSPPVDLRDGLAVATPARVGLDTAPLKALKDAVAKGDYPRTTSVLIVRDGKLVYEEYFGEGGRDVLNNTRSAMKSITSLAVGAAIGDGRIPSQHARAFAYLSDLRPFRNDTPAKEAITIEDLLTMSSALECNDDDDKSPGNEENMHPQANWSRWAADLPTMEGYERDATGFGPWRYCAAGPVLLGQILQRVSGERADRYIGTRILQPLGIRKWEWPYSPSNEPMTGGGLRLRSRDLAKIAAMIVDGGRWNGQRIVGEAWIDSSLAIHRRAYADANYGYFFWQRDYETACGPLPGWYMSGNGGNVIVILRQLRTAIVVTRTNYNTRGMHQETVDLLQRYVLGALPCKSPPR